MGDQGDKTEEPTPHKLREARKKGQVVKSKEVTTAMLFFATYYMLRSYLPRLWLNITGFFTLAFTMVGQHLETATLGALLQQALFVMLLSLGPIMAVNFGVAIVLEALQTGFNLSGEPLKPKLNKINPIEGFKRLFSIKGLVELAKSIAKMGIIFYILQRTIVPKLPLLMALTNAPILGAIAEAGKLAFTVAVRVGMFYLVVAVLDYFWQRHQFMKQMRMSKQEIKDEYKKLEGDPLVKQRQRDMALSLASGRRTGGAAGADAVVTNPTHIAVALQYDSDLMVAPQVVAKGKMLIAEEIKQIASENNVYIMEDKELAWSLFNTTEVGESVPPEFYPAVAEILALVYDLRRKRSERSSAA